MGILTGLCVRHFDVGNVCLVSLLAPPKAHMAISYSLFPVM